MAETIQITFIHTKKIFAWTKSTQQSQQVTSQGVKVGGGG